MNVDSIWFTFSLLLTSRGINDSEQKKLRKSNINVVTYDFRLIKLHNIKKINVGFFMKITV